MGTIRSQQDNLATSPNQLLYQTGKKAWAITGPGFA
jgi:hypothetical protein